MAAQAPRAPADDYGPGGARQGTSSPNYSDGRKMPRACRPVAKVAKRRLVGRVIPNESSQWPLKQGLTNAEILL